MNKMTFNRCDLHVHTAFSPDGHQSMQEACARAAALGLDAICFTEHLDFCLDEIGFYQPDDYFAELERMRERFAGQMQILAGLEFSQPHHHPRELEEAQRRPYDFILGSVHDWNGGFLSLQMQQGLTEAYICETYWAEILQMVRCGGFDAAAHLDFPKRYLASMPPPDPAVLDEIFAEMVKRGLVLELNTSSLRAGCPETMPGDALLARYKAAGGAFVTLGSDAHQTQDIFAGLPEARKKAEAQGLRPVYFVGRRMHLQPG